MDKRRIRRYQNGVCTWEEAPLADERRVDILVGGRRLASVMASPFQLDALAVGFLFGKNLIGGAGDIESLSVDGLQVRVELGRENAAPRAPGPGGVKARPFPPEGPALDAAAILELSEEFDARSRLFRQTGAVHSCGLIDGPNRFHADDVARHNAFDKVIGQYLIHGPSGGPGLLLTTGRVSAEILMKSAKAGIGALISRGAPTDRAAELARRLDMIMIGFARRNRFNIYHGGEHIADAPRNNVKAIQ
jgi:FdhD protein